MRRPFERRCVRDVFVTRWLAPLSLLVVILIVGNSLFSYGSLRSLYDRDAAVTHTELVRGGLNALLVTLDDAETGQRGYLLTGDQAYLQPYDNARTRVAGELNSLAGLTRDNPVQRGSLGRLTPLVREKLAELEQTVTLRRQGRQAAAVGIVRTNRGQRLMDAIRGVISAMGDEESHLLAARTATARDGVRNATITIALATVVELALLVVTMVLVVRGLAARAEAAAARRRALEQEADVLRAANQRMDEFLSIVTHELRSPLTAIKGNVQLAARRVRTVAGQLDAPARERVNGPNPGAGAANLAGLLAGVGELLARTDQVSARMTRLVTDLLDATRIGAGRLEIARAGGPDLHRRRDGGGAAARLAHARDRAGGVGWTHTGRGRCGAGHASAHKLHHERAQVLGRGAADRGVAAPRGGRGTGGRARRRCGAHAGAAGARLGPFSPRRGGWRPPRRGCIRRWPRFGPLH